MSDEDLPPAAAALVSAYVETEHDYLAWLDTRADEITRGRVVMTIPYDSKLTNPHPDAPAAEGTTMHGGVAATLVDTAGGIAQRTTFDDPLSGGVATVNLSVNYLRPARGDLTATAEVVRAGETIGVSTITVRSPTDGGGAEPVATGQGAYRLFRE